MPTTTIRIPEELKARVASAARRSGQTTHGFILEAIAEKTDMEERRHDFEHVAEKRFAQIASSGEAIPWNEMRSHLEARLKGKPARRPVAKKRRA